MYRDVVQAVNSNLKYEFYWACYLLCVKFRFVGFINENIQQTSRPYIYIYIYIYIYSESTK